MLHQLFARYEATIATNPEVLHLWLELVVARRLASHYTRLTAFLADHQSMGVFLYTEMAGSGDKRLARLARETFEGLQGEMDNDAKAVVRSYLKP